MREDIVSLLAMRDPALVVRGVDRPNLFLECVRVEDEAAADRAVERVLFSDDEYGDGEIAEAMRGKGIVYTATTRVARELAARLRSRGVAADHYHGRRRAPERGRVQEAFAQGALRVVVATNAFGLGIDDPDIRFVVHRDPPGSIEAWWQEAGRAGRDGRPARCVLVHRPAGLSGAAALTRTARVRAEDLEALVAVLRRGPASAAGAARSAGMGRGRAARAVELMEQAGAVRRRGGRLHLEPGADPAAVPLALEERRELHERTRAAMLRTLAETGGCRREVLLPYLGDLGYRGPCGACDNDRGGRAAADPVAEAAAGALGDAAAPGARVVHPEFGEGVVQGMADGLLTVLFDDAGVPDHRPRARRRTRPAAPGRGLRPLNTGGSLDAVSSPR
ncbi:MAG: helicase-related protein [Thermoleophilia bacterium]